ncbi:MAG: DNA alkylation repair protein [Anaerovoracaceae bacterium]
MIDEESYGKEKDMRNEILEGLRQKRDVAYKAFNTKLIPGVPLEQVIGVRLPQVRALAKELAKEDFRQYIAELPDACYYEERMIHGMVIGYGKLSVEEWKALTRSFVPHISDWATCDSVTSTMKIAKTHQEEVWPFVDAFLQEEGEFSRRFGVVMLLAHYINEAYIDRVLDRMAQVDTKDYYVMMAVAWCLSVCYVKFPEKTKKIFLAQLLDEQTQNKAIQKIRESNRISKEEKEKVKELKR